MIDNVIRFWSQITVVIGAFGIFLKIIFDYKVRQKEIKYSSLYENKILEIKSYYKSYHTFSVALQEFYFQIHFGKHDEEIFQAIRQRIYKAILDYEVTALIVKLFLNNSNIELVDKVSSELESVRVKLELWLIDQRSASPTEGWQNYLKDSHRKLTKEIPLIIKTIEVQLRKSLGT